MVSAATYATGNTGSPVSSAYMANTLTTHISIVRGALLFSSWVHIRGGCNSNQLSSSNISNRVQAVPEEVQEPETCKPFPAKVSGDTQGVEVSMEEGTVGRMVKIREQHFCYPNLSLFKAGRKVMSHLYLQTSVTILEL